jgi:hypothetical protein
MAVSDVQALGFFWEIRSLLAPSADCHINAGAGRTKTANCGNEDER